MRRCFLRPATLVPVALVTPITRALHQTKWRRWRILKGVAGQRQATRELERKVSTDAGWPASQDDMPAEAGREWRGNTVHQCTEQCKRRVAGSARRQSKHFAKASLHTRNPAPLGVSCIPSSVPVMQEDKKPAGRSDSPAGRRRARLDPSLVRFLMRPLRQRRVSGPGEAQARGRRSPQVRRPNN